MNKKLREKNEKYKLKKIEGITLISLVITIVVLIILAGVAIYLSLGDNGIFTRAREAKEVTNKAEATDIINLKITTAQMNKYAEKQVMPTLQELADVLYEDKEIQYVALESKVASKEKITVGDNTSIYTKLNKYPYEFEINSSLQLASINGVKIATNSNSKGDSKVIWEGSTKDTKEIKVNWKQYRYIIFYCNDFEDSKNPHILVSSIYDFDTINVLKVGNVDIRVNGYNTYYINIRPNDEGFKVIEDNGFYLKRIVGIY